MKLEETENTLPQEKEWWEQRRKAIELELLGGPPAGAPSATTTAKPSAAPTLHVAGNQSGIVDSTNQEKKKAVASK